MGLNGMTLIAMEWVGMQYSVTTWYGVELDSIRLGWNGMDGNGIEWNKLEWNGMDGNGMTWIGMDLIGM